MSDAGPKPGYELLSEKIIGTLNEGPLHGVLKERYRGVNGLTEQSIGSFIADVVRDGVIYEIQTGSFSGLQRKLRTLLDHTRVVLVHPIAKRTLMRKQPTELQPNANLKPRYSPKRGSLLHIVEQLVYLGDLLNHENFAVEVVLTTQEETRVWDPRKGRGRGAWRIVAKHLVEVVATQRINAAADLFAFLRAPLPAEFTTADLAEALQASRSLAQKMAYCLRQSSAVEICGKRANALIYRRID